MVDLEQQTVTEGLVELGLQGLIVGKAQVFA
jgi:hypothetical protein